MTAEWTPDCMDGEELADWQRLNRSLAAKGNRADRPCADCLPAFAMEMRGEGRCNGVPMGHVKEKEPPMPEPIASLSARRLTVTVAAPCGTCAHAPVCRIRPEVESMRTLQVAQPSLDDAVSLSLSADVTCAHYVKGRKPAAVDAAPAGTTGRKLNLSDEERERRRQQAIAMSAARREQAAS